LLPLAAFELLINTDHLLHAVGHPLKYLKMQIRKK